MDQQSIAGIGNVYSDEILFQAGEPLEKKVGAFSQKERKHLFHTMKRVLQTAIRHQADPGRFPRTYLTPRRREGEQCPKCGAGLRATKVNGRRAWYCPQHQH